MDGSAKVGPTFKDVFGSQQGLSDGSSVTVDENYLRESILEPQAKVRAGYKPVMPTYQGQLKDEEISALIAYIKSLSETGGRVTMIASSHPLETTRFIQWSISIASADQVISRTSAGSNRGYSRWTTSELA